MSRFCSALAMLFLVGIAVYAQQTSRNLKREQVILEQLGSIAPASVETFQRGTAALDKRDYSQAAELFREVVKQAPAFTPALRRLGFSLAGIGQRDEALRVMEEAVKIERSPENLISLAETLAYPEGKQATTAQKESALALAKEANAHYQGSDDSSYPFLVAQLAGELRMDADFRQATKTLVDKYPDQMATHYFNAIRLALDEDWIAAEEEIRKAEHLGLPAKTVQEFLASGIHTRAVAWRWAHYAIYLVAAWLGGLFLLFVAGKVFSTLTLRFIESTDPNASASRAESGLRRIYRGLINVAGSYYYVSMPVVIFLVLAVTSSIIYGFLALGRIPIKLVLVLVIGAIVTVYKMVQSLFIRMHSEQPGRSLSQEEAPGLWSVTREVAEKLGTRPFDEIRVVPGTEMAVYEQGSYQERRKDQARRTLLLGLGLVPGFTQNPFRAVLAHEYGHLSHRDTAGGDVALRVNRHMMKFVYAMAEAGQAVWWNIAFQFLRVYHFLFRRISHGATRLQEVLADRAAARLYGAAAFEEGLRHVVRRQIEFNHYTGKEVEAALTSGRKLQNVYALEMGSEQTLEDAIHQAMNRPTSEDDTHPSPVDRFRLVSRVVGRDEPVSSGPMWELFANPEAIGEEMSLRIEALVKAAGA